MYIGLKDGFRYVVVVTDPDNTKSESFMIVKSKKLTDDDEIDKVQENCVGSNLFKASMKVYARHSEPIKCNAQ